MGKNIPTVAEVTQGEVIKFAAAAAESMRADGCNVLMEGRAQTLNYVRTDSPDILMLPAPALLSAVLPARSANAPSDPTRLASLTLMMILMILMTLMTPPDWPH